MSATITKIKPGTGVLNYEAQVQWLEKYESDQMAWIRMAHPDKTEGEYQAYQAGLRTGWNELRGALVLQGIVTPDWSKS